MMHNFGPLSIWITGATGDGPLRHDPSISIHWRHNRLLWVRFGRHGFRFLDERYPDMFGKEWHYAFGGWLSWRR